MDNKQIKSKLNEGYIMARAIIEVAGKPKEYVSETISNHIKKIKSDKNYIIIKETSEKPEESEGYFSTFSELEFLAKDSLAILSFCFDYMPASIEIIEPERVVLENNDFSNFLNDMQARLHAVNTGVLELNQKNVFYIKNTAVLLRNFIVVLLSQGPMAVEKMIPYLGIKKEEAVKILEVLTKEGKVKKEGSIFKIIEKK